MKSLSTLRTLRKMLDISLATPFLFLVMNGCSAQDREPTSYSEEALAVDAGLECPDVGEAVDCRCKNAEGASAQSWVCSAQGTCVDRSGMRQGTFQIDCVAATCFMPGTTPSQVANASSTKKKVSSDANFYCSSKYPGSVSNTTSVTCWIGSYADCASGGTAALK